MQNQTTHQGRALALTATAPFVLVLGITIVTVALRTIQRVLELEQGESRRGGPCTFPQLARAMATDLKGTAS